MPWLSSHPHKHLIRDLWPDKHLYAAILLVLGAAMGATFTLAARFVPITFATGSPSAIAGWNWPFGIVLPAIVFVLAGASYRLRSPTLGFIAAGVLFTSAGALGVSSLLALAAIAFLFLGRREGEHENPDTRALHVSAWPDKALSCALLFAIAAVASIAWGAMLLTGWLGVRTLDVALWGWGSVAGGLIAIAGASLSYRQRSLAGSLACVLGVLLSFSFIFVGPALAIALAAVLVRAYKESEFAEAQPAGSASR